MYSGNHFLISDLRITYCVIVSHLNVSWCLNQCQCYSNSNIRMPSVIYATTISYFRYITNLAMVGTRHWPVIVDHRIYWMGLMEIRITNTCSNNFILRPPSPSSLNTGRNPNTWSPCQWNAIKKLRADDVRITRTKERKREMFDACPEFHWSKKSVRNGLEAAARNWWYLTISW